MKPAAYSALRRALGYSQRQLAKALGIHPQTVSKRERGVLPVSREAQLAITNPKLGGKS